MPLSVLTTLSRKSYSAAAFDAFSPRRMFDLGTARALAWMCQLAYEAAEPGKVHDILQDWDMEPVGEGVLSGTVHAVLPIAKTEGVVASGHDATILAFAGTDPLSLANWITDLDARTAPNGMAGGYKRAFEAVLPSVVAIARAQARRGRPLFLTGHSLGGALAVVAAHELQASGVEVEGVYTFGMPRPGDAGFADTLYRPLLGARTYRLVYGADIVPTVAPSWMGFRHVGRLLLCRSGSRFGHDSLSDTADLDDPHFVPDLPSSLREPASKLRSLAQRLSGQIGLAAKIARGEVPARQDSELVAAMIELLPPGLRDHLPDRYIGALTPPT